MFRIKLKELREQHNLSQYKLAAELGLSQSAIGNWEAGTREPNYATIKKIAQYFNVSPSVLLDDDNTVPPYKNMFPLTPYVKLPIFGEIRAGTPICTEQGDTGEWEYADVNYGDGQHFMLRVNGDSMMPTIPDGSIAIIRSQNYAEKGQIVAFALDGDYATLKRYFPQPNGTILLRADNPEAESYVVTPEQLQNGEAHIIGVVRSYKVNM